MNKRLLTLLLPIVAIGLSAPIVFYELAYDTSQGDRTGPTALPLFVFIMLVSLTTLVIYIFLFIVRKVSTRNLNKGLDKF